MQRVDTLWTSSNDQAATEFLNLGNHRSILDIGCGGGMWTWTLRRLSKPKSAKLVGLDSDRGALKRASKILGAGTGLIAADASFLPIRKNSFDLVTCRRLLINLRSRKRRKIIREMIRVTKVGGVVSSAEPSLQTNAANQFSTLRGSSRFYKRLEKAVSGTDFTLGPRVAYLLVREGLEKVNVWAYLLVYPALPPRYGDGLFLNPVVHGGGFTHSLTTVTPPLRGEVGSNLRREAKKLDREMTKQVRERSFVSVSAIPMFVTKGTKPGTLKRRG